MTMSIVFSSVAHPHCSSTQHMAGQQSRREAGVSKASLCSSNRQLPFHEACTIGSILFTVEKNSWIKTGEQRQRTSSHVKSTHLPACTAYNTYRELKFSNQQPQFTKKKPQYLKTESISKHK